MYKAAKAESDDAHMGEDFDALLEPSVRAAVQLALSRDTIDRNEMGLIQKQVLSGLLFPFSFAYTMY